MRRPAATRSVHGRCKVDPVVTSREQSMGAAPNGVPRAPRAPRAPTGAGGHT
jgi:hypothetical protein